MDYLYAAEKKVRELEVLKKLAVKNGHLSLVTEIKDRVNEILNSVPLRQRINDDHSIEHADKLLTPDFIESIHRRSLPTGGRPPCLPGGVDSMARARAKNLARIAEMTEHDAPGIYESKVIEEVNSLARNALGIPTTPAKEWGHNKPEDGLEPKRRHLNRHALAAEALDKLSGNLSHDNVAAAKQILKKILVASQSAPTVLGASKSHSVEKKCGDCRGSGFVMTTDSGVCGAEEYRRCPSCKGTGEKSS